MQWLLVAIFAAFVGWAVFRGFQAASYNKAMAILDGEPTDAKVRQFIDTIQDRQLPNARQFLDRLAALDQKVARSPRVSPNLKAELHTIVTLKGVSE